MGWEKQLAMVLYETGKGRVNHGLPTPSRPSIPAGNSRELPVLTQFETDETRAEVEVRWNMVFTWQAPMMLMSYSVLFFISGLSIFVLAPLYDGREFDGEGRVSVLTRSNLCKAVYQ